jgi:nucleoside-diphosphate-sugar epimerase
MCSERDYKLKNILVTGALGHIGSKLIRSLSKNNNIIAVDDFYTQRYCSLFNLENDISFIESSFSDIPKDVISSADAIIHLAAVTDAVKSFNSDNLYKINIEETKKFIDTCAEHSSAKFIFPSSTSVYGVASDLVSEDDDSFLNPQSPYAESKVEIEDYIKGSGIDHIIFRLGTIFGISEGMRFHTAINKFCYQAALGLPLTVWSQNFDQFRPYLGINDCIGGIDFILRNGISNQTYNLITENYKLSDIIDIIKTITDVELNMVDTPLLNQFSYKVDYSKILSLGFNPKDNLESRIKSTVWMLKCVKSY